MSSNLHTSALTPSDLAASKDGRIVIDVRKPAARRQSGYGMPGAVWLHPFAAAAWAQAYRGRSVVVFCVHGHEVSQAVRGFLDDMGADALMLEGGFEAWREAGYPVEPLEARDA